MKQMALQFGASGSRRAEDFSLTKANQEAYRGVLESAWPQTYMVLTGPSGSGKTHLASIWANARRAPMLDAKLLDEAWTMRWQQAAEPVVIDALETLEDERSLFHVLNLSKETDTHVLVVGGEQALQSVALLDLKSRLLGAPKAVLGQPDDELLRILFIKHFSDRQLHISPDILQYLVNHVERSGKAIAEIVRVLDEQALEKKQNISLAFLRKYLPAPPNSVN